MKIIENNKIKKGISLIVLIITIAIIIILATAVILSIANNRPIESAKEATASHNDAVLKESAATLSAQWEVDRLLDSSIGSRSEYVMQGLSSQGFTEEERERIKINEETGEILIDVIYIDDVVKEPEKYLEKARELGQIKSTDIGIGTDGKIVNLDIWNYELKEDGISICGNGVEGDMYPSYKGEFVNGEITGTIPQCIYLKDYNICYDVVSLYYTFGG